MNDVEERVAIQAECKTAVLNALPLQNVFLVCDCEGCEFDLLDPSRAPDLAGCHTLVELHDFACEGVTAALQSRFAATHEITLINTAPRDPDAYTCLRGVKRSDRLAALSEARPGQMQWAFMQAKRIMALDATGDKSN